MTAKRKSVATAVACASAVAVLAGCAPFGDGLEGAGAPGERQRSAAARSGDALAGLDAGQIADKAVAATRAAKSLTMAGRIEKHGEPVSVDLALDSDDNCSGLLGVNGGRAELRRVSDVMYLQGDETFWAASLRQRSSASPGAGDGAVMDMIKGRWIKMPEGSIAEVDRVCDLETMLSEMDMEEAERKQMTKGPDGDVDGVGTMTLVRREGSATTTVHVAKEGEPRVLKIVKAGGAETGTILLSGYDRPVTVEAPSSEQILDLENLTEGAGLGFEAGETPDGQQSGTPTESGAGPDAGTATDGGTGTDSGTAPRPDTTTGTGTGGTGTSTGTGSGTGSRTGTGGDSGAGAGTAADGSPTT